VDGAAAARLLFERRDKETPLVHDPALLQRATEIAQAYLASLPERRVAPSATPAQLRAALGGPLPEAGETASAVLERLARGAEPGILASSGPRFFGFVIGGSLPAALAADWLAVAWDQNCGLYATSPANSVCEETAAGWILELLDLPRSAGVGFTTGGGTANFTCLAAARHALLARRGWDVEARGLYGAPEIALVASAEAHVTIASALRQLGLGSERVRPVPTDERGRMRAEALASILADCAGRPILVCAQAGNVNTGDFDPLPAIVAECRRHGAWLHVDGAFGLWAAAAPERRHLVAGAAQADSWACDAHKWLNTPYDCGISIVADAEAQRAAMRAGAAYLVQSAGAERDPIDYVPEFSRRARGFAVWAALRSLGRQGVADLVERCCLLAAGMAERLAAAPGVEILNQVVLNQVLVRFHPGEVGPASRSADADDAVTREVVRRVQEEGTCWLSGTTWQGKAAMRISVVNWATTARDAELSADAILRMASRVRAGD
jgi:glutamate/tyrosine decarboxylase-like PLP-dependent enzyme